MDRVEGEAAVAAAVLCQCRAELAARGSTVIREVTGGAEPVVWRHYPDGEAYDPQTHAQYFYHRHPPAADIAAGRRAEHGHFHLFLRAEGMPAGVTPLLLPELAVAKAAMAAPVPGQSAPLKRGGRDEVCHLVAIAVDAAGEPIRLLATNRWVTGEIWYPAADVLRMLDRFRLTGSGLLDRWLDAFVALFRTEIAALLRQRDKAAVERRWRWRTNVLDDPRLEILASLDIDLDAKLAAIDAAAAKPTVEVRRRLPRMAEGWGA